MGKDRSVRVACIGDSITWGFTLLMPWKQSYPALLQEKLGPDYEVRNFGYNDAAARFDADTPYVKKGVYRDSLAWEPDIVLLMLGTNDTKRRNWDPDIFRRDYRKLVQSYLDLPSIREIAAGAGLELVDLSGLFTDSQYCVDGVHPQAAGARMLAEAIYSSVEFAEKA